MNLSDNTFSSFSSMITPETPQSSTSSITTPSAPMKEKKKRRLPEDFYLSDEEVLGRLEETLKGILSQFARYKQKIRDGSSRSRYYRSRLGDLQVTITNLQHDIRIHQLHLYGYVASTSTRSGRIVRPVARCLDKEFLPGSNNRNTKGQKVDVGESTKH